MDSENIKQRLETHPTPLPHAEAVSRCIAATLDCAQSCAFCADACLAEQHVERLSHCIRLDLDCADVCELTGRMLSRHHTPDMQLLRATLELCSKACDACASECENHAAMHAHCKRCADACRRCEQACNELLGALT